MQNWIMNENQGNVRRLEQLYFKGVGSQKAKFEPRMRKREPNFQRTAGRRWKMAAESVHLLLLGNSVSSQNCMKR